MAKTPNEIWEEVLTGNSRGLMRMRSIMGAIPAGPRCKLCQAPFGRPGRTFLKLIGSGPSPLNRRLCKLCIKHLHEEPGGAEVDVGFAGERHAERSVRAGRDLLEHTGNLRDEPWVPIGIGVHTGVSFVGTVGEGDAVDFTALGDTVNAASRIAGMAAAGELLVSEMTAEAAGLETDGFERRTLELRGREQPVDVWVAASPQLAAATA